MNIGKNIKHMPLSNPPKLLLNEHLSPRLAVQLCKHGFDVISSQEACLLAESDDKQLEHAASQQRAIVSLNIKDFSLLHEHYLTSQKEHWGIVFSTTEPIGVLLRRLLCLLYSVPAGELKNQILWLNKFK